MRENADYVPSKETIQHVQEVLQLMAVLSGDSRFEEVNQGERSETNMCEFLDRVEARGEARGVIKGTVAAYLEFGMDMMTILEKVRKQFQLDELTARKYVEEAC